MVQALQLKIKGMTCAACAQASERAVRKLAGVEEAAVNFATEKLLVKFEDGKLTVDQIKAAVAKAGYTALAIADTGAKTDEHKAAKEREIRVLWTKFAVSALFSISPWAPCSGFRSLPPSTR
jgi:Cu+-exporting ATPase